jgi:hypothetical protein
MKDSNKRHCLQCEAVYFVRHPHSYHQRFCTPACRRNWHKLDYDQQYALASIHFGKYIDGQRPVGIGREHYITNYLIKDYERVHYG